MEDKINKVAHLIAQSRKMVVFTGAGISTESGIPDFRGPGGMWTKYDPDDFTIDKFLSSRQKRIEMWKILLEGGLMDDILPNPAHYALAELEKMGKLSSVITQNVDNLHQKAGNHPSLVHELHGNMQWVVCLDCGKRYPLAFLRQNVSSNNYILECDECQGILKPDVVFFGEALPQGTLMRATQEAQECDLFIVIGSSLVVYPAAYMPIYAKNSGAGIVIINRGETAQNDIADVFVDAAAGATMSGIIKKLKEIMPRKNS